MKNSILQLALYLISITMSKTINILQIWCFKEAPSSWFGLKHFSYRSESSQNSRVEPSRSGEVLKKYL